MTIRPIRTTAPITITPVTLTRRMGGRTSTSAHISATGDIIIIIRITEATITAGTTTAIPAMVTGVIHGGTPTMATIITTATLVVITTAIMAVITTVPMAVTIMVTTAATTIGVQEG